jgi:hypothetical protein
MRRVNVLCCAFFCALAVCASARPRKGQSEAAKNFRGEFHDYLGDGLLRFRRLSAVTQLSQARVAWIVQDQRGFMWFATQYWLNQYDGYKPRLYKNEPDQPLSLSCVYVRSLLSTIVEIYG